MMNNFIITHSESECIILSLLISYLVFNKLWRVADLSGLVLHSGSLVALHHHSRGLRSGSTHDINPPCAMPTIVSAFNICQVWGLFVGSAVESWGICLVWGSIPSEWHSISLLTHWPGPGPMGHVLPRPLSECLWLLSQPMLFSRNSGLRACWMRTSFSRLITGMGQPRGRQTMCP